MNYFVTLQKYIDMDDRIIKVIGYRLLGIVFGLIAFLFNSSTLLTDGLSNGVVYDY